MSLRRSSSGRKIKAPSKFEAGPASSREYGDGTLAEEFDEGSEEDVSVDEGADSFDEEAEEVEEEEEGEDEETATEAGSRSVGRKEVFVVAILLVVVGGVVANLFKLARQTDIATAATALIVVLMIFLCLQPKDETAELEEAFTRAEEDILKAEATVEDEEGAGTEDDEDEEAEEVEEEEEMENPPFIGAKLVGQMIQVSYPDDEDDEESDTTWWDVEVMKFNKKTEIYTVKGEEEAGEEFESDVDLHDTFWRYPE